MDLQNLLADPRLVINNDRVLARGWMVPLLRSLTINYSALERSAVFEQNCLPFALITTPRDLFDHPHLLATGGLAAMDLPDGRVTRAPLMPITLGGERLGMRLNPPRVGEHTNAFLAGLNYTTQHVAAIKYARKDTASAVK